MGGYDVEHDLDDQLEGYQYIYQEDGNQLVYQKSDKKTFRDCYGAYLSFVQNPIGVDVVHDCSSQLCILSADECAKRNTNELYGCKGFDFVIPYTFTGQFEQWKGPGINVGRTLTRVHIGFHVYFSFFVLSLLVFRFP